MGGGRPIGLAIGIVVTTVLVLLPALVVPIFYLFANVYAMITGGDFASDTMNVAVFFTGLVMTVTMLLLLMAGGIALTGRGLAPKKRDA